MRTSRIVRTVAVAAATATAGVVWGAGSAHAGDISGGGEETETGYGAGASYVSLSGDYSEARVGAVARPAPLCYWSPVSTMGWPHGNDPERLKPWWLDNIRPFYTSSTSAAGAYAYPSVGGSEDMDAAIRAQRQGRDVSWYHMERSAQARDMTAEQLAAAGCGAGTHRMAGMFGGGLALVTINWYETGAPPEPVVDPQSLAEYAYEVMDLVEPTLEWNPRIGALGQASLVNLPTWLWVEEAEAVGERSVTATAGPVSVTVTARTDGVSITSPAGTTECSVDQARTAYSPAAAESEACTLTFDRASRGYAAGFPVDARTAWEAEWTSNVGDGGALAAKSVGQTTDIPVAESQTVVTDVD